MDAYRSDVLDHVHRLHHTLRFYASSPEKRVSAYAVFLRFAAVAFFRTALRQGSHFTSIFSAQNSALHFAHFFRVSRSPSSTTDFVGSGFRKSTDVGFAGLRVYISELY